MGCLRNFLPLFLPCPPSSSSNLCVPPCQKSLSGIVGKQKGKEMIQMLQSILLIPVYILAIYANYAFQNNFSITQSPERRQVKMKHTKENSTPAFQHGWSSRRNCKICGRILWGSNFCSQKHADIYFKFPYQTRAQKLWPLSQY